MKRGFTMIEMLVALAISGVVAAAAIMAFVSLARATRRIEQQAHADDEVKVLTDVIMTRVQQAGGGQLRPWMVLEVDDNQGLACQTPLTLGAVTLPACDLSGSNSDRLHVVIGADATQCTINTVVPSTNAITQARSPTASCCVNATDFDDRSLVLVGADGSLAAGQWTTSFCTHVDPGNCACNTTPALNGYASPLVQAGTVPNLLDGGVMMPGTTLTYFLDHTTGILSYVSDEDNDGVVEVSELADHVADFQVQLGFDTDGDQVADLYSNGYPTGAGAPARSQLRSIRLGIMIAAPVPTRDTPSSATLLNGGAITHARGVYLRKVQTTATLRNLDLFF